MWVWALDLIGPSLVRHFCSDAELKKKKAQLLRLFLSRCIAAFNGPDPTRSKIREEPSELVHVGFGLTLERRERSDRWMVRYIRGERSQRVFFFFFYEHQVFRLRLPQASAERSRAPTATQSWKKSVCVPRDPFSFRVLFLKLGKKTKTPQNPTQSMTPVFHCKTKARLQTRRRCSWEQPREVSKCTDIWYSS